MSKRFFDSELFARKWFRKASPAFKAAWFYLMAHCDAVGVWIVDTEAAEYVIGEAVDWEEFLKTCNGNIEVLSDSKWWLVDFCEFQYGELKESCKPHKSYLALLKKHGLLERVSKGYGKAMHTLQEKEKEKEQAQDKETEKEKEKEPDFLEPPPAGYLSILLEEWAKLPAEVPKIQGIAQMSPQARDALEAVKGIHSDDVLQAIRNFGEVCRDPVTYWPTARPGFGAFFRSGLFERCHPANFPASCIREDRRALEEARNDADVQRRVAEAMKGLDA